MARLSALIGAAVLGSCDAWGPDGHTIVAHVADALLDPAVNKVLLADLGKESLSQASDWCDDFDHSDAGRWSESLHFINYPRHECTFDWSRDCKDDRCNAGALSNYTSQVWDQSLSADARLMALNFMIHMMGDLHQPLHVASGDDRGGNDIRIRFKFSEDGKEKKGNLHAVWDSHIIEQILSDLSAEPLFEPTYHNWQVLSDDILKRVKGEWASNATTWASSVAEKRNDAELRKGLTVAAGDTAAMGCEFAYVKVDGTTRIASGDELSMDYYQRSKPVVSMQLAKGAVRLAQLLKDSLTASRLQEEVGFFTV